MLVLSRQTDQGVRIGSDIRVKIVDVRGNKVRLGIDAPLNVQVHREEVAERILEQGRTLNSPFELLQSALREIHDRLMNNPHELTFEQLVSETVSAAAFALASLE